MASSILKAKKKCIESYGKQRHHFADKGLYSQSYGFFFPVVLYRCEKWTIKKAERWRIDAFDGGEDSWKSLGQQGEQTSKS